MTREEKIKIFEEHCNLQCCDGSCDGSCVLDKWCSVFDIRDCSDSQLDEALLLIGCNNNVDHPTHYNRDNAMECIDEMLLVFGKDATMNFCLLNAWKYRYRAADKNGVEDLKKSDWYLKKVQELRGE